MKIAILLSSLILSSGILSAQCCGQATARAAALMQGKDGAKEAACDKEGCDKKKCDEEACGKCACKEPNGANAIYVAVEGMTCDGCSTKLAGALKASEGVTVHQVCHQSGTAKVTIDPTKSNHDVVVKVIAKSGFTFAGDITHMEIEGMSCSACSDKLSQALGAIKGVTVKKVCHKSGSADFVLGAEATMQQVSQAIIEAGFKAK